MTKWKIVASAIMIIFLLFIIVAVSKNKQLLQLIALQSQKYRPTKIPKDTTNLFEYEGHADNDLAYIYVQGGPNLTHFDRKLSPFTWMPESGKYIRIFPYQSQMINKSILGATPTLTPAQARQEVTTSAELLFRTIVYYKNRNKKVYVFCISHGSQIGLELLKNHPPRFDGLALTMIRLDIDQEAIDLTKDGKAPYFTSDDEVTAQYLLPRFMRFSRLNDRVENMTMLMKVCRNRYTNLLEHKDLSRVVYVYGKYDNKVGHPKKHELEFLKEKKVKILELACGHDDLGGNDYINQINQLLLKP
jgi:hypothetical protein